MVDLKAVTCDDFAPCLHQTFTVVLEPNVSLDFELVEVERRGAHDPSSQARAPFSVLFAGAMTPVLPQGIYRLKHTDLGEMELFLVAIGPDATGMRYEAVFT